MKIRPHLTPRCFVQEPSHSFFSSIRILFLILSGLWFLTGLTASAITYPPLTSLLYGNSSVNQVGQTSKVNGSGWGYRYLVPKNYNPAIKYPVILFLHGSGEGGAVNGHNYDNEAQLTAGSNSANGALSLVSTANPDNQTNYPCFFVAPQNDNGFWPSSTSTSRLLAILTTLKTYYSIDEDRICLTGLSAGAFGTWDLSATTLSGIFSCLVPLSGGAGTGSIDTLQPDMPIWAFHAADDSTVGVTDTESSVYGWRDYGRKIIFTRYNSNGHTATVWKAAYQTPLLLQWMLAQRRGQPMVGIYDIRLKTASHGTTLDLAMTTPTAPAFTQVGWSSNFIGNGISASDGVANGTVTFTSTSTTNFQTKAAVGSRIGINYTAGSKTFKRYYDIGAIVSSTEVTLTAAAPSGNTGSFTIYPRGTDRNPTPGTGSGSDWSLTAIPLTTERLNLIHTYAIGPSYSASCGGFTEVNEPFWFAYNTPIGDTTAPILNITGPTTSATYTTSGALNLTGTASDNSGLSQVTWTSSLGYSGTATGISSWSVDNVPLVAGPNKITVTTEDSQHNFAIAVLDVTYTGVSANQPPGVTAGAYQEITWPTNSVILTGTVSDDGLPAGAAVTQTWTKASGPGPVSFSNPASTTSTATFFQPGSYVLRLTASDTALATSDDVIVTVRSNGTAVIAIDCGSTVSGTATDGTIYDPDPLTGSITTNSGTFDGAIDQFVYKQNRYSSTSTPITYNLPIASGTYDVLLQFGETTSVPKIPGVRLIDVMAENQLVINDLDILGDAGRYVAYDRSFRTVVTDGTLNLSFNKVINSPIISGFVVRNAILSPKETWLQTQFGENASNPVIAGDQADADGDGLPNLLEYAGKLNPNSPSRVNAPSSQPATVSGSSYLALTFRRLVAPADVTCTVEASSDLTTWSPATAVVGTPIVNGDGTETVTIRDFRPIGSDTKRFLRLRAE